MKEDQARFIKADGSLSKKAFKWDIPKDLKTLSINYKKNFIGLGRWNADKPERATLFWCIACYNWHTTHATLFYIEHDVLKSAIEEMK